MLASDVSDRLAGSALLERLDSERLAVSNKFAADPQRRAGLGQFMTPANVASFMASMLDLSSSPDQLRILDPGGVNGMLTAAVVAEICSRPETHRPSATARRFVGGLESSFRGTSDAEISSLTPRTFLAAAHC